MANKDLFKQAIADAKSIREAAIANAKLALEESLTPQLKELLAQRLAEMEEEEAPAAVISEEETVEEELVVEEATEEAEEETLEEAIGPDGLVEVEAEEEEGEGEEAAGEEGEAEGEEAGEEEAEGDSEESEDEAGEEEVGEMSVEDLKDLIRDVLMQVMGDEETAQEDELEAGAEDMEADDMTAATDDTIEVTEEINIDELMAELAQITDPAAAPAADAHGNLEEEEQQLDEVGSEAIAKVLEALGPKAIDLLAKAAEALQTSPEGILTGMLVLGGVAGIGPLVKLINATAELGQAAFNKVVKSLSSKQTEEVTYETPMMSAELDEALSTIETLRNELNETNLLNAKLLYVNKVFKANNLTESQKANVIASFDKAETVKEVKLVYETVSENATATGKKEVVREAKGFASAATGSSTKPAVIAEANAAVLRMQKLAGIIK